MDGESKSIDLVPAPQDEANIEQIAKSNGWKPDEYPRIANLYWLDVGFLVRPGAEAREIVPSTLGVLEAFDEKGRSFGRETLRCDFDPEQDSYYIRGGLLVVIKGGKSANDAVHAQMAAALGLRDESGGNAADTVDLIRVDVYDLNRYYAAKSSSRR